MVVVTARPLRANDDPPTALNLLRSDTVLLERLLSIVTVEKHDARALSRPPEERKAPKLRLRDETAPRHFHRECKDVEPAHVVGDHHGAVLTLKTLGVVCPDFDSGRNVQGPRP